MAAQAVAALRAYLADYSDWPPKDEATKALPHADAAYVLFNDRARHEIEDYASLLTRPRKP